MRFVFCVLVPLVAAVFGAEPQTKAKPNAKAPQAKTDTGRLRASPSLRWF
jgi:hypothetical protein